MAKLDTLIDKVIQEAEAAGEERLKKARNEKEQEVKDEKYQIEREEEQAKRRIENEQENRVDREKTRVENQNNLEYLAQKQDLIGKVYTQVIDKLNNLPEEEFINLIKRALSQVPAKETRLKIGELSRDQFSQTAFESLQSDYPFISLNEETVSDEGGFILEQATIDYNFMYNRLLKEYRIQLSKEVSDRAFS